MQKEIALYSGASVMIYSPYRKNLSFYTAHRHNLRFCKTTLQVVYRQNGLRLF